jgi:hypothetical protein
VTKGERLYKDMKALGGEVVNLDMDMDKEGATLRKDQNSWKREAHK